MGDTYKKRNGNAGLDGVQFQIDLLTVFTLNALRHHKNWKISTENAEAGKFDDVVLEFEDKSITLLQAKRKQWKKVTKELLLSVSSRKAEFSLPKYFFEYQDIKTKFTVKNVIICTNTELDVRGLESYFTYLPIDTESLLYYDECNCSFIKFNDNILPELKSNSEIYYTQNLETKSIDKAIITEDNIKDFLENLQFVFNYPSGEKLCKVIELLSTGLNKLGKTPHQHLYKKMENWYKETYGIYLTEMRAKAMFCELKSEQYCETLNSYNIVFTTNDFNFTKSKRIFHIIAEDCYLLQILKVHHALKHDINKTLYVNPEDDAESQKLAIETFQLPQYVYLIIVWFKLRNNISTMGIRNQLKEILTKNKYKKVIVVTEGNKPLVQQIGLAEDIADVDGLVRFEDFSENSREMIITKNNINFQGYNVSLRELLATDKIVDYTKILSQVVLEYLVRGEEIKVGEKIVGLDEDTIRYYIHRSFITIDYTEQFREWQYKNSAETHSEKNIFQLNEKVILIADSSGMGKSTVINKLSTDIKQQNSHLWIIVIDLAKCTRSLRDSLKKKETLTVSDLLNSSTVMSQLERSVFEADGKVVLMLDGVDEISPDYTKLILTLLRQCREAPNLAKIFVTTRLHMTLELEEELQIKSFALQPLSEQEQVDFLMRYWTHNLQLTSNLDKEKCKQYATALTNRVSLIKLRHQDTGDFAANPILLRMIAEIFQDTTRDDKSAEWISFKDFLNRKMVKPKLPQKLNLGRLYTFFIDKKRDIFLNKTNPTGNILVDQTLLDLFEESLACHRRIAVDVILEEKKKDLFPSYFPVSKRVENDILRIGIVQKLHDKYYFIHRTFAEYFLADNLVEELRHNQTVTFQMFLIEEVFSLDQFNIIRSFVDYFLHKIIDTLPSDTFHTYQCFSHEVDTEIDWISSDDFVLCLAREGCLNILQLLIKCIDFKTVKDREMNIQDRSDHPRNWLNLMKLITMEAGINFKCGTFNQSLLHCATISTTLPIMEYLVELGANVDSRDIQGFSPLHYAARCGDIDIINFFKQQGSDFNALNFNGLTPLHQAANYNTLECVKFIVECGTDINIRDTFNLTAIHYSLRRCELSCVEFFIKCGEDINAKAYEGRTLLHGVAEWKYRWPWRFFKMYSSVTQEDNIQCAKLLVSHGADLNVRDESGLTPLHYAARANNMGCIKYFIEVGMDINAVDYNNSTPLHYADDLNCFKYIIEHGANINVENSDGMTPLHLATHQQDPSNIKLLIEKGASVNVKHDEGFAPLHSAACQKDPNNIKVLIENGASVNVKHEEGCTPLHHAALDGNLDCIKVLMKHGALMDVCDEFGNTPLHIATTMNNLDCVMFFVEQGADINARNSKGRSMLHCAVQGFVQICLEKKHLFVAGNQEYSPLDCIKFLIQQGADIDLKDNDGYTPYHIAVKNSMSETAEYIASVTSKECDPGSNS